MVRRVVGLSGIVASFWLFGCASQPSRPAPAAATQEAPATVGFPRVTIHSSNNFADERDTTSVELSANGAFTTEHVMSNGGSTSTVTVCRGELPASQAAAWVARIRSEATRKAPPRGPSREVIEREKIHETHEVSYSATAGEALFADPEPSRHDLEKLLEELRSLSRCSTS